MIGLITIIRPSTLPNMVKVEGVSQQWCNQFGTRVLAKLTSCYNNSPDLSLDNFINEQAVSKATGPVSCTILLSDYCTTLFNDWY